MARTTIFHFKGYLLGSAMLLALAPAPAPGQAQVPTDGGQVPNVHIVQDGETLWNLAVRYFGDPYLWPEIYRLNTLVVEDPHWIFPGEELVLVAPEPTPVDIVEDSTEVELVGRTPFDRGGGPPRVESTRFRPAPVQGGTVAIGTSAGESFRAVRSSDFYASGFLSENERLPLGEVRGAAGTTGGRIATATSAVMYQSIEIDAPAAGAYQIGDTLLLLDRRREVSGWGNVMVPTGMARVTNVSGRRTLALLIGQFQLVHQDQFSLPLEPFRDPGNVRPQPVEGGMRGSVIAVRDRHPVPIQGGIVFIDLGREAGVVPGDVFEVVEEQAGGAFADAPDQRVAILRIVHVRNRSASGMLTQIYGPGVAAGARVKLTLKMPT